MNVRSNGLRPRDGFPAAGGRRRRREAADHAQGGDQVARRAPGRADGQFPPPARLDGAGFHRHVGRARLDAHLVQVPAGRLHPEFLGFRGAALGPIDEGGPQPHGLGDFRAQPQDHRSRAGVIVGGFHGEQLFLLADPLADLETQEDFPVLAGLEAALG